MDKGKNNQKRPAGTGRTKITLHIGRKSFTGYIDQIGREDSLQSTDKVDEQNPERED